MRCRYLTEVLLLCQCYSIVGCGQRCISDKGTDRQGGEGGVERDVWKRELYLEEEVNILDGLPRRAREYVREPPPKGTKVGSGLCLHERAWGGGLVSE